MILTQSETAAAMKGTAYEMHQILEDVSLHTGLSVDDLASRNKRKDIIQARQLAFWHGKRCGLSLTQIGAYWDFDHTTVLHGIRSTQRRIDAAKETP